MNALLTLGLLAQLGGALPADSVEALRERALRAEARFERLSRQLAPLSWSNFTGSDCDEIVGRFCLRFDSTGVRPPALDHEAARVVDARREAVETLRRYFSAAPGDRSAAGPLVRLLIRDGRAGEGASAAGAYAVLSGDTAWGELLQGLAWHWAGDGTRAERHFIAALGALSDEERRAWLDPAWLLDPGERRIVRGLGAQERAEYERKLWLVMDPFWYTPANERWNEHMGRNVEARLLADVPVVAGMLRWGRDLDELTIRYGTPVRKARQRGSDMAGGGMVEYWDTAQRTYAPARLTRGLPYPPDPGERPILYAARARSGYTMHGVDRVLEPAHQVTRFLRGDTVLLRVDAAMQYTAGATAGAERTGTGIDSTAAPPVRGHADSTAHPVRAGLFVYDSAFTRRAGVTGTARLDGDTARISLLVAVRPGHLIYSAEMMGDSASPAGRARYALDARIPPSGPIASDLLIARPFDSADSPDRPDDRRLAPFEHLVFRPGDTLGIFAEAYRLRAGSVIGVEVALESAGRPSLLGRFARWIGRGLGWVEPGDDPRVSWHGEAEDRRYVIALNVPLPADRAGLHDLVLQVTDQATGAVTESRRRILIR
ncbi:MAG: hypothetical protein KFH98_07770 [Gemmatimonadetes bacterium]|nr:hypothetical protein [Gemmatimonadota bacterium]